MNTISTIFDILIIVGAIGTFICAAFFVCYLIIKKVVSLIIKREVFVLYLRPLLFTSAVMFTALFGLGWIGVLIINLIYKL